MCTGLAQARGAPCGARGLRAPDRGHPRAPGPPTASARRRPPHDISEKVGVPHSISEKMGDPTTSARKQGPLQHQREGGGPCRSSPRRGLRVAQWSGFGPWGQSCRIGLPSADSGRGVKSHLYPSLAPTAPSSASAHPPGAPSRPSSRRSDATAFEDSPFAECLLRPPEATYLSFPRTPDALPWVSQPGPCPRGTGGARSSASWRWAARREDVLHGRPPGEQTRGGGPRCASAWLVSGRSHRQRRHVGPGVRGFQTGCPFASAKPTACGPARPSRA